MNILKLKPACKDYLWGGHRLVEEFGIEYEGDVCAEAWVLSCHKDGESTITNGIYKGKELSEFIATDREKILGTNCSDYEEFPILIKLIDAKKPLSIQVHPDDEYAREHENQYGKTEMWYILGAEEGAFLYQGFEKEITKEEFEKRIKENTLEEVLHKVYVKKGDVI
ncbi:MAG: class I mannose-6-phosphate isomerase, partial [Treponema sp.]|nr:class I mannose-6-phosphate isomerase [Treponema sp.]